MLYQISRKNEFSDIIKDKMNGTPDGRAIFDEKEIATMNSRLFNMIGKDPILQDSRDPLGANSKTVAEQKLMLDKYKIFNEYRCDLDFVIQDFSSNATNSFKTKARNTKGTS